MFNQYNSFYFAILKANERRSMSLPVNVDILEYLNMLPSMDTVDEETIIEYILIYEEYKLLPISRLSYSEKCLLLQKSFEERKTNVTETQEVDDQTSYETISTQDNSDDETSYDTISTQEHSDDESIWDKL